MTLLPSSIEGLMGLREEQPVSLSFKGLELGNESPLCGGYSNAKWEWFSEPLDCPPNEGCSPEPMVGTMSPLGGNPQPFQGGEEVSEQDVEEYIKANDLKKNPLMTFTERLTTVGALLTRHQQTSQSSP